MAIPTVCNASNLPVPTHSNRDLVRAETESADRLLIGFTPMEAIVAATRDGGALMGLGDQLGQVRPGYLADLLLVDGDPLADVSILEDRTRLITIMKDGVPQASLADSHGRIGGARWDERRPTRLSDPATVRARDRTLNCTNITPTNGVCSMEDTLSSTMPCGFILTRTSWTSPSEDTAHAALGSAQIFRALTMTAREVLRAIFPARQHRGL